MINRRDFLKEVCPTVAFAFFGMSFLESCSADSLEKDTGAGTTPPTDNGESSDNGGSSDNGYTKSGPTYTIEFNPFQFFSIRGSWGLDEWIWYWHSSFIFTDVNNKYTGLF